MQGTKPDTAMAQFGPFELNLKSGELRRQGMKIKLQPQPRQILRALLKTPGAIVTREELRRELWPEDTFVDFESGLNTAVNRLRIALGDSAEYPRYIETLSRSGYRFIGLPDSRASGAADASVAPGAAHPRSAEVWKPILIATGCISAALGSAAFIAAHSGVAPVRFQQVTFSRGQVSTARFTSSQEVVYTAQWEHGPRRLFLADLRSPVSRLLGFENLSLQAVSSSGELAVLQGDNTMNIAGGTLSRVMRNGGPSTMIAPHVFSADWSPGGNQLAFVRVVEGAQQLEFPPGHVLYKTSGWVANVRISPAGDRLAFVDHPVRHDDAGAVEIIDATGNTRTISPDWASVSGLSWRNPGEVWFTATKDSSPRSLWAVTADGGLRSVGQAPGILTLRDISSDGRVLVTVESRRLEMAGRTSNEKTEHDFSLTDWSRVQQLSGDASLLLFDESGEGSGSHPIAYVRNTRTEQTTRLGEGWAQALAPDSSSALLISEDRKQLLIVPVSGGSARPLDGDGLKHQWARFFPDGSRLLTLAAVEGEPLKLYVRPLRGTNSMPLTGSLMVRNVAISPDGKSVAALDPDGKLALVPVASGPPVYLASKEPLAPIRWSVDGQWLFVQHLGAGNSASAHVSKIRVATGETQDWKTITPADPIGVNSITGIVIADDERSYAYSYRRVLSGLYVASGWR